MKKLLGILALVLMFCSNVYAASISDLLKSGKSIKLICTVDTSIGKWIEENKHVLHKSAENIAVEHIFKNKNLRSDQVRTQKLTLN